MLIHPSLHNILIKMHQHASEFVEHWRKVVEDGIQSLGVVLEIVVDAIPKRHIVIVRHKFLYFIRKNIKIKDKYLYVILELDYCASPIEVGKLANGPHELKSGLHAVPQYCRESSADVSC